MIRERIGQAALRAYPPAVRRTRGPEMLGMALDAGEQSTLAFVRESGSLVLGGLRARKALTMRAGARRLIADSCCQAVVIWLMLWLISVPNVQIIAGSGWQQLLLQAVILTAILVCALIGYERVAAVGGLAAITAIIATTPFAPYGQLVVLARVLIPVACLSVMVLAPQKRPRNARQLAWLVPVSVLAALHVFALVTLPEVLALTSLGGLLRLAHDPRLAIACSVVWIGLLAHIVRPGPGLRPLRLVVVTAAGLMVIVAAGRRRTERPASE